MQNSRVHGWLADRRRVHGLLQSARSARRCHPYLCPRSHSRAATRRIPCQPLMLGHVSLNLMRKRYHATRVFPSPLWGGARGGGQCFGCSASVTATPLPNPPPQGGREHRGVPPLCINSIETRFSSPRERRFAPF